MVALCQEMAENITTLRIYIKSDSNYYVTLKEYEAIKTMIQFRYGKYWR
jgi:hypothetical protein